MGYHLDFSDQTIDDINFHLKSGNKAVLNKIYLLLDEISEHPFSGTGKPELLKYNLLGNGLEE